MRAGAASVSYATTSDARLKEDIVDSKTGLQALMALQVRDYRYPGDDRIQQGLVAQDVAKIYPIAVHAGGDDPVKEPWMLDYGRLTPLLIKGFQEQQEHIARLEKKLAALQDGAWRR
jgi:hypothetical protein